MCDLWRRRFSVSRPLAGLPWPRVIAQESVGAMYRVQGRNRRHDAAAVLQITLSGLGRFTRGKVVTELKPGTAFLCRVGDPSVTYAHSGNAEPWCFCFMAFYGANDVVEAVLARDGFVFNLGLHHQALRLVQGSRRFAERAQIPAGEASLLVQRVLASIIDTPTSSPRRGDADLVQRAQDAVTKQTAELTTVSLLAQHLAVSREHLTRAFQRERGVAAKAWLQAERLDALRERLVTSTATVAELAQQLGFASVSRLCKNFRELYGDTPERYRRFRH